MAKKAFVPMYNLDSLTEEQKIEYYQAACEFYGIPANLNLLAFIWTPKEDGSGTSLILYAKKGATDIIRANKGISTIELSRDPIPGTITYLAVGQDKEGRVERAIGSISIEGLTGKKLASAVMTAQTRAVRRMTLQFMGGGVTDESELPDILIPQNSQVTALDSITEQPTVVPSMEPGTTVTPEQQAAEEALRHVKPEVLATAAGEKPTAEAALATPEIKYKTVAELAATLPADNPLAQAAAPAEAPKQRKRKPASVTLNTPDQEAKPETIGAPTVTAPSTTQFTSTPSLKPGDKLEFPNGETAAVVSVSSPATMPGTPASLPAQAVKPPAVTKMMNEAEEKEVRERINRYRNETLPKEGKMVPTEGVGGIDIKFRLWVSKFGQMNNKPLSKTWNYADWKKFLDYMDEMVRNIGAEGLVKFIDAEVTKK